MPPVNTDPRDVGLPLRPFLYTIEQISTITALSPEWLDKNLYFVGRSVGIKKASQLEAHNVASPGMKPEWRVSEPELIRWLKAHRFRVHERGFVR